MPRGSSGSSGLKSPLSKMLVKELRAELDKRGLPTNGLKQELIERLQSALENGAAEEKGPEDVEQTTPSQPESEPSQPAEQNQEMEIPKAETPKEEKTKRKERDEDTKSAPLPETPKQSDNSKQTQLKEEEHDSKRRKQDTDIKSEKPQEQSTSTQTSSSTAKTQAQSFKAALAAATRPVESSKPQKANSDQQVSLEKKDENESNVLFIKNFVRPFTLNAVGELLKETGTVIHWGMDSIKSKCYVVYENVEQAKKTKETLDGRVWPPSNTTSKLSVSYSSINHPDVIKFFQLTGNPLPSHLTGGLSSSPSSSSSPAPQRQQQHQQQQQSRNQFNNNNNKKEDKPILSLDDLFRKTKVAPHLYWLPLNDQQIQEKKQNQEQKQPQQHKEQVE